MRYIHKAIEVEAFQVTRPYRDVTRKFPRSHPVKLPNGSLSYFRLVDAPEGANKAYDGDWIVKHTNGQPEVLPDHVFKERYGLAEEPAEVP